MLEKKTVSQCISSDYCKGWNDAIEEIQDDLLERIQQLEAGIEEWEMVAASPGAVEDMARENAELLEKVKQLERERDAAIHDVAYVKRCRLCKHGQRGFIPRVCFSCAGKSNFEWRGPCEENGGSDA